MTLHRPVSAALLALNGLWCVLLLSAPFLVPAGTARHLDGVVNVTDHADRWAAMPALPRFAYGMGDLVCHQMESRSLLANGNQFPVDARLLPMFAGASLGLLLVRAVPEGPTARAALARMMLPRGLRPGRLMGLILAIGLAPTGLDGTLQLLTSYESTNPMRVLTGAILGVFGALWLALVFDGLAAPELEAAPERSGHAESP